MVEIPGTFAQKTAVGARPARSGASFARPRYGQIAAEYSPSKASQPIYGPEVHDD
jgi:hypothetical protein